MKLRVWWQPQVPMSSFYVYVDSIEKAVLILNTLGDYDEFQFKTNVKPDYSNSGGLEEMGADSNWSDWDFYSDELGENYDDPVEYLEALQEFSNEKIDS